LYGRFLARTTFLVRKFESPLPRDAPCRETCLHIHEHGRLNLVIRLQFLWAEFCRELVVRSALGNSSSLSGTPLAPAPGVSCLEDITNIASAESRGRHPPWHKPTFAASVAAKLGVQNLAQIRNGLSPVSAVTDLIVVRNYIVHPNQRTKLDYVRLTRRLGCAELAPVTLLATYQPGGATLFEVWVADLQTMALNAVR
jgi:hypothetical protein